MAEPKAGDKVSWKSHGSSAHGTVKRKLVSPTTTKGHKVAASRENPEFLVEARRRKARGAQGTSTLERLSSIRNGSADPALFQRS